ncbi:MAG: cation-translocating P-type ATPase, partial [Phycisphaerae bacterium]|nr:cation-translocating P-type ATPase [Phycisphaerae bacterium]
MLSRLRLAKDLLIPVVAGLCLLAAAILPRVANFEGSGLLVGSLLLVAYLVTGVGPTIRGATLALKGRFDIDFLMALAAIGAAAIGEFMDGALLLFLFALGHSLEHYAMGQARRAISALASLAPRRVRIRRHGAELDVPVDDVLPGELAIVRPGERVGVDGRVARGASAIDQSPITGESMPVEKGVGDEVFAGTLNGDGAIEVEVTRAAADSTMARMIRLVEEAQSQKSRVQRAADRFTRIYVPCVLVAVVLTALLPPTLGWIEPADGLGPWSISMLRAISLLVGASPCALAISTPAAVLAGVAQAARSGVLIKGGAHLESLALVRVVALDKTGTITLGRPQVTVVTAFEGADETQLVSLAAALEQRSNHPLARAIVAEAARRGASVPEVRDLVDVRGKGVTGVVDGSVVRAGALRFFEGTRGGAGATASQGADATGSQGAGGDAIPPAVRQAAAALERAACTVVVVSRDDRFVGAIGLRDEPRTEAASAMARLARMGIDPIVMLTGDNEVVARAIAAEVGIREVRAALLPEDKIAAVAALAKSHRAVAMVGDGVNDAPALAAATVGVAMGGGGADVALEAADVALMRSDLGRLPFAISLGRAARRIVLQNVAVSMGMVAALIPLAILGWLPVTLAVILHEGSTVAVV